MKALVTGAAGFIGSNLLDRLLLEGYEVIGVDNFSTGKRLFLQSAISHPKFEFFERDLLDPEALNGILSRNIQIIFHLAANADVRDGLKHPRKDLEQNTLVTWNVLEAARKASVPQFTFASTGSVYGEASVIPTPETCPFPIQTSLYGASKLAGEALISAYSEGYGIRGHIFRFVSIVGERYSHGHVYDFVKWLSEDPKTLPVLGNGKQRKSYLHVRDCIDAILLATQTTTGSKTEIYNLGTDEYVDVNQSIDVICDELKVNPVRQYQGGDRGWVGDNPFIFLDCSKMRSLGWKPKISIRDGVRMTVRYLRSNL